MAKAENLTRPLIPPVEKKIKRIAPAAALQLSHRVAAPSQKQALPILDSAAWMMIVEAQLVAANAPEMRQYW